MIHSAEVTFCRILTFHEKGIDSCVLTAEKKEVPVMTVRLQHHCSVIVLNICTEVNNARNEKIDSMHG